MEELRRILTGAPLRQLLRRLRAKDFFFPGVPASRVEGGEIIRDCREVFRQIHDFTEGWIVLSGRYRIEVEGRLSLLKRGDVVLLPAGTEHVHYWRDGDSYRFFGWCFLPLSLTLYLGGMGRNAVRMHSSGHHLLPRADLPEIELLERLPNRAVGWSSAKVASHAGQCLSMLFEAAGLALQRRVGWSGDRAEDRNLKIEAIGELIRQRYYQDLNLTQIARAVGLSPAYCCDIFSRKEKMSPMAYLCKVRLDAAAKLLATTNLLAKEVAARTGFSSANYFIRRFRRAFGVAPIGYRASLGRARRMSYGAGQGRSATGAGVEVKPSDLLVRHLEPKRVRR